MTEATRLRVVVSGHVRGVFFRDSCRTEAQRAGVAGWVRNRGDGQVEAVFEGPREAVDRMAAWCRRGPQRAEIDDVEITEEPAEGLTAFEVR